MPTTSLEDEICFDMPLSDFFCLQAASCKEEAKLQPVAMGSSNVEKRIGDLESEVKDLRALSRDRVAYLKPNSQGWNLIQTSGGMPLRVAMDDLKAKANGSQITLQIGNPSSVDLRECSADIGWGETNPDGSTVSSSWHSVTMHFPKPIPAGDFAPPEISLADISPDRLGAVTVGNVDCLRWQKAAK